MNDQTEFRATLEAMTVMKFTDTDIKAVFRVVSAVLLLGNLEFNMDKTEQATMANDSGIEFRWTYYGIVLITILNQLKWKIS